MSAAPPQKPVQAPKVRSNGAAPPQPRSRRGIYGLVAVTIAAVAILAVGVTVFGPSNDPELAPGTETIATGLPQNGLVLGDPGAPVTIAEYADLQCPFCKQLAAELPAVVDRYVRSGQVKLELRGLAFIGDDSLKALRFVQAAADENKAWDVTDLLYRNQGPENSGWVSDELLEDVSRAVGLDYEAAAERAASPGIERRIRDEAERANELGIGSTPTILIGKSGGELRRVELESLEAEALFPIIDEELAAAA